VKKFAVIAGLFAALLFFLAGRNTAQSQAEQPAAATDQSQPPVIWSCPMDPEVHSLQPGKCPRCGMALVAGIPDPVESAVRISVNPKRPSPGQKIQLTVLISDPKTGKQITDYQIVHEKLFHMFIVSQDLKYFLHDHPVKQPDGEFQLDAVLPKPGMYRILSDFYPQSGTPQLIERTIFVPGAPVTLTSPLKPDVGPQEAANMQVSLATDPPQPIAGEKTLLYFHLDPAEGLEPYLGVWSHMLVVSDDLVDMIHTHPFIADGGPQVQFDVIFPRARVYRVWVQFQRKGVINTAAFSVPVSELK
jgi:heavy metal-binding protein